MFNKKVIRRNGRTFYEGNARINKYLHLAQNIYLAKTGKLLMNVNFYAYDNGAVIPEIQTEYANILTDKSIGNSKNIQGEEEVFLRKVFIAFQNVDIDELIEIDHEDEEWVAKKDNYDMESQKMDTMSRAKEYAEQYKDMVKVMDRMTV